MRRQHEMPKFKLEPRPDVAEEITIVPEPVPTIEPAKVKKQRIATRCIQDLDEARISSMTETEMTEALRDDRMFLSNKVAALDANCNSAYEKVRELQTAYDNIKIQANSKVNYALQQVAACHSAIMMVFKKEE